MKKIVTYALSLCLLGLALPAVQGDLGAGPAETGSPASEHAASTGASMANHETYALEKVEIDGCTEHSGVFTFPASQADPYLPHGFKPTGVDGDPLPAGRAVLIAMLLVCDGPENGEASNQFLNLLVVDPPEAYTNPGAAIHYVNMAAATDSPALQENYTAWGIGPIQDGGIVLDGAPGAPGLDAWTTTLSVDGVSATMTSTAVGNHPELSDGSVRIFGVEDQRVTGIVDLHGTAWEGALGEASLPDDTFVPVDVDGPGVAYHAWGIDYVIRPAGLPGST